MNATAINARTTPVATFILRLPFPYAFIFGTGRKM